MKKLLLSVGFLTALIGVHAQTTVEINPDKDNSIYSEDGSLSSGLGQLYSGQTCSDNTRRALIHFDIAGSVPAGAVITDVTLTLNVNNAGPDATSEIYGLHAVSLDWGEGTSADGGAGSPAVAPDATWSDAMFGTSTWTAAGGDFEAVASATSTLTGTLGDYTWSSDDMVSDVQGWLLDPATNFGWLLMGDEEANCAARRFGSKDIGTAPALSITYCLGGAPTAVCEGLTLYLDETGEGTISAADLDGGSTAICDAPLTFSASQTTFDCEDIFAGPIPDGLVISAVYDGPLPGGIPKGVELYVYNNIADLSVYGIGSANNGEGSDGEEFTFPEISVDAGTYIYIASEETAFTEWFGFAPDYTSGSMSINGDDAIELFKDGAVIDIFGLIDVDGSGEPWEYMDGWAHRVSETGPDGTTFDIANWTFSGINALDGEATNETAETPIPVGTYTKAGTVGVPVTLTVTDGALNTDECVATVMVFDTLAPVVACVEELTIVMDATGMATILPADLDAGTTDGCGIDELTLSMSTFTCEHSGANDVWLIATDIYGNSDSCMVIVEIDDSEVITVTEDEVINPECGGDETGEIYITVTGGAGGGFSYDWDNDGTGDIDDPEDLTGLGAGTYNVVATDENGCKGSGLFELTAPDELTVIGVVMDATCGNTDGSIDIDVDGGTFPYTYDWDNDGTGDTDDTQDLGDLAPGDYTVVIEDDNGCTVEETFTVGIIDGPDVTVEVDGGTLTAVEAGAEYQWVECPDYTPIDGATDQSYVPTEDGSYAVIITTEACSDTSDCFDFLHFSIEEVENKINVVLYPNPSSGLVNVQMNGINEDALITVRDIKGSVVLQKQATKSNEIIDLTNAGNGIYFVQVQSNNNTSTQKITIHGK